MNKIKSIAEVVDNLMRDEKLDKELLWIQIKNIWEQKISTIYKENVKLVKFSDGILYLWTDVAVWRKEVQLRSQEIATGFNIHLKSQIIMKVKI